MATPEAIERNLEELFDAERTVRRLHEELSELPDDQLLDALAAAVRAAGRETREPEATLRLVRLASLLGEMEGPRVVDTLIDILASEHPEPRQVAGAELEELAFDRFKEVAKGIERALKRLPAGSPALPELPFVIAEVPEPGVPKVLAQFLSHEDADAVAAAIEVLVEIGETSAAPLLEKLLEDKRTVELADEGEDGVSEVTLGELAADALDLLRAAESDDEEDEDEGPGRRGGAP